MKQRSRGASSTQTVQETKTPITGQPKNLKLTLQLRPPIDAETDDVLENDWMDVQDMMDQLDLSYSQSFTTIPLDQIKYLKGRTPVKTEAREWAWEPITQKFVNRKEPKFLTRSEFLELYYPRLHAERQVCRRVPVAGLRMMKGRHSKAWNEQRYNDVEADLAVFVYDRRGDLVGTLEMQVPPDMTREEIVKEMRDKAPEDLRAHMKTLDGKPLDYRLTFAHPRLFVFEAGEAVPGAPEYDLYGSETAGQLVQAFDGLPNVASSWLAYVMPVIAIPTRTTPRGLTWASRRRRLRAHPVFKNMDKRARLHALGTSLARYRAERAELERNGGRTLEEREREWAISLARRRSEREARQSRGIEARKAVDSVNQEQAEGLMVVALEALYKSLMHEEPLGPEAESAIAKWLASAVLSGRVVEGTDYAAAYHAAVKHLLNASERRPGMVAFIVQMGCIVDSAEEIDRFAASMRDRVPLFDPDTNEVVGYEEQPRGPDDADPSRVAVEITTTGAPVLPPSELAASQGAVQVARAQCHTCGRWRAVRTDEFGRRVGYVVRYDGGSEAPSPDERARRMECTRFLMDVRHMAPNGDIVVERVPPEAQYVVVRSPSLAESVRRHADALVSSVLVSPDGTTVAGFGTVEVAPDGTPQVEWSLLPTMSWLLGEPSSFTSPSSPSSSSSSSSSSLMPAERIDVYEFDPDQAVEPETGAIRLVHVGTSEGAADQGTQGEPFSFSSRQDLIETVPDAVVGQYTCITADGVKSLPRGSMHGYDARQWECGDPTTDPHSDVERELIARLRDLQKLDDVIGNGMPPDQRADLRARMARIRSNLHAMPQESIESIEQRMSVAVVPLPTEAEREAEEALENLDALSQEALKHLDIVDQGGLESLDIIAENALDRFRQGALSFMLEMAEESPGDEEEEHEEEEEEEEEREQRQDEDERAFGEGGEALHGAGANGKGATLLDEQNTYRWLDGRNMMRDARMQVRLDQDMHQLDQYMHRPDSAQLAFGFYPVESGRRRHQSGASFPTPPISGAWPRPREPAASQESGSQARGTKRARTFLNDEMTDAGEIQDAIDALSDEISSYKRSLLDTRIKEEQATTEDERRLQHSRLLRIERSLHHLTQEKLALTKMMREIASDVFSDLGSGAHPSLLDALIGIIATKPQGVTVSDLVKSLESLDGDRRGNGTLSTATDLLTKKVRDALSRYMRDNPQGLIVFLPLWPGSGQNYQHGLFLYRKNIQPGNFDAIADAAQSLATKIYPLKDFNKENFYRMLHHLRVSSPDP